MTHFELPISQIMASRAQGVVVVQVPTHQGPRRNGSMRCPPAACMLRWASAVSSAPIKRGDLNVESHGSAYHLECATTAGVARMHAPRCIAALGVVLSTGLVNHTPTHAPPARGQARADLDWRLLCPPVARLAGACFPNKRSPLTNSSFRSAPVDHVYQRHRTAFVSRNPLFQCPDVLFRGINILVFNTTLTCRQQ
jgi:hypothetical protein